MRKLLIHRKIKLNKIRRTKHLSIKEIVKFYEEEANCKLNSRQIKKMRSVCRSINRCYKRRVKINRKFIYGCEACDYKKYWINKDCILFLYGVCHF